MRYWDRLNRDKQQILDVRREEVAHEGPAGRAIARMGEVMTHPLFFIAAVLLHVAWMVLNVPALSPITPWDPPPFTLLATIASVEAPLLALLVLMRQQQDRRIQELGEDTDLQTTLHAERETSRLLEMMERVHEHLGIEDDPDPELEGMTEPLDPERLLRAVREEMEEAEENPGAG